MNKDCGDDLIEYLRDFAPDVGVEPPSNETCLKVLAPRDTGGLPLRERWRINKDRHRGGLR